MLAFRLRKFAGTDYAMTDTAIAYHEAGHAVAFALAHRRAWLPPGMPLRIGHAAVFERVPPHHAPRPPLPLLPPLPLDGAEIKRIVEIKP